MAKKAEGRKNRKRKDPTVRKRAKSRARVSTREIARKGWNAPATSGTGEPWPCASGRGTRDSSRSRVELRDVSDRADQGPRDLLHIPPGR